jgi:hypothetical protein
MIEDFGADSFVDYAIIAISSAIGIMSMINFVLA